MKSRFFKTPFFALLTLALLFLGTGSQSAHACAACYGKSDSTLAAGMNWGILTLLVFISCVLGTVASFFVFLARRSASMGQQNGEEAVTVPPTSNNL